MSTNFTNNKCGHSSGCCSGCGFCTRCCYCVGARGPRGPQGERGSQGSQGEPGAQGPPGSGNLLNLVDGNADGSVRGIHTATDADKYILGVVCATPAFVGDSAGTCWRDMYLRDAFGEIICEWVEEEQEAPGGETEKETVRVQRPKLNPAYDPERTYVPRDQRKEWAAIGMLGKLIVRDDGTCREDGFCKVGIGGVATASESGYLVLGRVCDKLVRIVVK